MRVNNTTRGLPSEYQEVEYIQSSGTQHFIVGTSFKTSYKSVIDFQMTQTGGDQVIIGFNFAPYRYGINAYSNNFKVITGNTSGWSDTISEDTNRHTLTIDKSTATVDGNNYTISGYTNVTVNGGIGVFAHNDNGVGNYFARVKIYKLDIYDESGTLIYHLVPCYRKSDTVIGMYDIVNNTFYTNSGTGTFTKGADVPSMIEKQIRPTGRLPSAYKEVEWIESSGTQYIDTGMQFTNNTTVSLDVNITTAPTGWTGVIGAQKNNVDTSWAIGVNTNAGTYQHGYAYGDWNSGPLLNQRVIYSNDATHLYIDGTSVKTISNGGTFTTPVNGTIFKVNYQNGTGFPYLLSAKLYNCKIYESGTLVRDLVPCYRKADSVIGMYDMVNDQFYTNSGTGTFTKGADV